MKPSAGTYLFQATAIVLAHASNLALPLLLFAGTYVPLLNPKISFTDIYLLSSIVVMLIVSPAVYGRFTAIVQRRPHVSWLAIFQAHWLNYFSVSLLFLIPLVLAASLSPRSQGAELLLTASLNIAAIYVFPLVFLRQQRLPSVSLGIKCLFGNLDFNAPLIALTLAVFLLGLAAVPAEGVPTSPGLAFGVAMLTFVVDLVIFVAASLILQDKLLSSDDRER